MTELRSSLDSLTTPGARWVLCGAFVASETEGQSKCARQLLLTVRPPEPYLSGDRQVDALSDAFVRREWTSSEDAIMIITYQEGRIEKLQVFFATLLQNPIPEPALKSEDRNSTEISSIHSGLLRGSVFCRMIDGMVNDIPPLL
jgi:hypothetical protein